MTSNPIDYLREVVGHANCLTDEVDVAHYATDYRKVYCSTAMAVVRPASTLEVSEVVRYCYASGIAVVPQGGNTSLHGGAVPALDRTHLPCIILSLSRLNNIFSIDPVDDCMLVGSGVTLAAAREAADGARRLFPLRIGSEGSCQIGGNLSTNAGGTSVLRYGSMRDLVLGLEVVLPTGQIWRGLRALRKDNTGYDLKQLFIGSEGTLGIITAAMLKLFPKPRTTCAALVATASPDTSLALLKLLKERLGHDVTAFELISRPALTLVQDYLGDEEPLFDASHDWYVLIEAISSSEQADAEETFHQALVEGFDNNLLVDALLGTSEASIQRFWKLREEISDAQTKAGGSVRCDISVPLSAIPDFINKATNQVLGINNSIRMVVYGHMGDGNVHFNPLRPNEVDAQDFLSAHGEKITTIVDSVAISLEGSISAEHGVGVTKRDELLKVKDEVELETAWRIKQALDPKYLMNPGKVLPQISTCQINLL